MWPNKFNFSKPKTATYPNYVRKQIGEHTTADRLVTLRHCHCRKDKESALFHHVNQRVFDMFNVLQRISHDAQDQPAIQNDSNNEQHPDQSYYFSEIKYLTGE